MLQAAWSSTQLEYAQYYDAGIISNILSVFFRLWVGPWISCRKLESPCQTGFSPRELGDQEP